MSTFNFQRSANVNKGALDPEYLRGPKRPPRGRGNASAGPSAIRGKAYRGRGGGVGGVPVTAPRDSRGEDWREEDYRGPATYEPPAIRSVLGEAEGGSGGSGVGGGASGGGSTTSFPSSSLRGMGRGGRALPRGRGGMRGGWQGTSGTEILQPGLSIHGGSSAATSQLGLHPGRGNGLALGGHSLPKKPPAPLTRAERLARQEDRSINEGGFSSASCSNPSRAIANIPFRPFQSTIALSTSASSSGGRKESSQSKPSAPISLDPFQIPPTRAMYDNQPSFKSSLPASVPVSTPNQPKTHLRFEDEPAASPQTPTTPAMGSTSGQGGNTPRTGWDRFGKRVGLTAWQGETSNGPNEMGKKRSCRSILAIGGAEGNEFDDMETGRGSEERGTKRRRGEETAQYRGQFVQDHRMEGGERENGGFDESMDLMDTSDGYYSPSQPVSALPAEGIATETEVEDETMSDPAPSPFTAAQKGKSIVRQPVSVKMESDDMEVDELEEQEETADEKQDRPVAIDLDEDEAYEAAESSSAQLRGTVSVSMPENCKKSRTRSEETRSTNRNNLVKAQVALLNNQCRQVERQLWRDDGLALDWVLDRSKGTYTVNWTKDMSEQEKKLWGQHQADHWCGLDPGRKVVKLLQNSRGIRIDWIREEPRPPPEVAAVATSPGAASSRPMDGRAVLDGHVTDLPQQPAPSAASTRSHAQTAEIEERLQLSPCPFRATTSATVVAPSSLAAEGVYSPLQSHQSVDMDEKANDRAVPESSTIEIMPGVENSSSRLPSNPPRSGDALMGHFGLRFTADARAEGSSGSRLKLALLNDVHDLISVLGGLSDRHDIFDLPIVERREMYQLAKWYCATWSHDAPALVNVWSTSADGPFTCLREHSPDKGQERDRPLPPDVTEALEYQANSTRTRMTIEYLNSKPSVDVEGFMHNDDNCQIMDVSKKGDRSLLCIGWVGRMRLRESRFVLRYRRCILLRRRLHRHGPRVPFVILADVMTRASVGQAGDTITNFNVLNAPGHVWSRPIKWVEPIARNGGRQGSNQADSAGEAGNIASGQDNTPPSTLQARPGPTLPASSNSLKDVAQPSNATRVNRDAVEVDSSTNSHVEPSIDAQHPRTKQVTQSTAAVSRPSTAEAAAAGSAPRTTSQSRDEAGRHPESIAKLKEERSKLLKKAQQWQALLEDSDDEEDAAAARDYLERQHEAVQEKLLMVSEAIRKLRQHGARGEDSGSNTTGPRVIEDAISIDSDDSEAGQSDEDEQIPGPDPSDNEGSSNGSSDSSESQVDGTGSEAEERSVIVVQPAYATISLRSRRQLRIDKEPKENLRFVDIAPTNGTPVVFGHRGSVHAFDRDLGSSVCKHKGKLPPGFLAVSGACISDEIFVIGQAQKHRMDLPLLAFRFYNRAMERMLEKPQPLTIKDRAGADDPIRATRPHAGTVDAICAISHTDQDSLFATGGSDHSVIVWKVKRETGSDFIEPVQPLARLHREHAYEISSLAYSPKKSWLFSTAGDCKIKVYDCEAQCMAPSRQFGVDVALNHIHINAQNPHVIATESKHTRDQFAVWDLRSKPIKSNRSFGYDQSALSTKWSTGTRFNKGSFDNVYFARGDKDGSVRIWDLRMDPVPVRVIPQSQGSLSHTKFHDGKLYCLSQESLSMQTVVWQPLQI